MLESEWQAKSVEQFVSDGKSESQIYGLQWGDPDKHEWLQGVLHDFLLSNLKPDMNTIEIGCGGGRWSRYFVDRVKRAWLVDATPASERAIRSHCDWPGFAFLLSPDGTLPELAPSSLDFAFSFDTFVHFERALFDRYLGELGRVLKPTAKLVLHYARRWPECKQDDAIFLYREDGEVERVLAGSGFDLTGRELPLRGGYGSIVREAIKAR